MSALHFPMQRKQFIGIARRARHSGSIEIRGPEERQDAERTSETGACGALPVYYRRVARNMEERCHS